VYQQLGKFQSLGIGLGLFALGLLLCSGGGWLGQTLNMGGLLGYAVAAISFGIFLGCLGGAVMFIARGLHTKGNKVYLYTRGLILTSKSEPDEGYRWDQIGGLRVKAVEQKVRKYTATTHYYSIRRLDGQQTVLSDNIPRMRELWAIVTKEVNAVLWPRIQRLYQQGKNISFGPLTISRQGISTSKNRLSWDQVKGCTIADGRVVVEQQGQQALWADIAADEFTNLPLLDRLTKQILESR
jgi:hypothetical protein